MHHRRIRKAQVPSKHPIRMFTEVGRRALPHCTAVGKVMLAEHSDAEARQILRRTGLPASTPRTIVQVRSVPGTRGVPGPNAKHD